MTPLAWGILAFCVVDLMIAGLVVRAIVGGVFSALADKHPAVDPAADAISKRFQSFSSGLANLGYSVHVAVDDQYLHLTPVKPIRALGARAASIPWSAVRPVGDKPGKKWSTVKVGMTQLKGPTWALGLAFEPTPDSELPIPDP